MTFTHYVPAFVASIPAAVCGTPCPVQHAVAPTCPRCAAWLEADSDGAEALELLWQRERATAWKGASV